MNTVISVSWQPHRVHVDEFTEAGRHGEQWTIMQQSSTSSDLISGFLYFYPPDDSVPQDEVRLPKNWIIV